MAERVSQPDEYEEQAEAPLRIPGASPFSYSPDPAYFRGGRTPHSVPAARRVLPPPDLESAERAEAIRSARRDGATITDILHVYDLSHEQLAAILSKSQPEPRACAL